MKTLTANSIGYLSEPVPAYNAAVTEAETLTELRLAIAPYAHFAQDAIEVVNAMDESGFETFRKCVAMERKGKYSGDENAPVVSVILMPEVFFHVTMLAVQFKVPWGMAFIRMKEHGLVKVAKNGHVTAIRPNGVAA